MWRASEPSGYSSGRRREQACYQDKKINAERGRSNGDDFDRSQPGDLILESLKEEG